MKRREFWLKVMQELAKSLEALGLTTLEGLTKKDLKKVRVDFWSLLCTIRLLRGLWPWTYISCQGPRALCHRTRRIHKLFFESFPNPLTQRFQTHWKYQRIKFWDKQLVIEHRDWQHRYSRRSHWRCCLRNIQPCSTPIPDLKSLTPPMLRSKTHKFHPKCHVLLVKSLKSSTQV